MRTFLYRTLVVAAAGAAALAVAPAAGAASADYGDDRREADHKSEEIHSDRDGYSDYTERYREKESSTWRDDFYGYRHGDRHNPND